MTEPAKTGSAGAAEERLRAMTAAPPHPGTIVRDVVMPDCDLPRDEAAALLGLPPDRFEALLEGGEAVTPEIAAGIARLCGGKPGIWVRIQETFDAWHALRGGIA